MTALPGITVGTLYTLRHSAATLMLVGDKDTKVLPTPLHILAARLGDSEKTILTTYAHVLPKGDKGAAVGMAQMLAG